MTRAQDIEAKAAEWLMRREQPRWSEADQAALAGWLEKSIAHKAAFWRLEHTCSLARYQPIAQFDRSNHLPGAGVSRQKAALCAMDFSSQPANAA